jgi:hypothetical protein
MNIDIAFKSKIDEQIIIAVEKDKNIFVLKTKDEQFNLKDLKDKTLKIICELCNKENIIKTAALTYHIRKSTKKYLCFTCRGYTENPFFGKKHSKESLEKMSLAKKDLFGDKNPFYGKHHTKETKEKIVKKLKITMLGRKNPFFGKHHTEKTRMELSTKLKELAPKTVLTKDLNFLEKQGLDFDKLKEIFEKYKNSPETISSLSEHYKIDLRTLRRYLIKYVCSNERFLEISLRKQQGQFVSKSELKLKEELLKVFGEKLIHQYRIGKYLYDCLIDNCLLIEYDGFYWHKIKTNKNDKIKELLAKDLGFVLYRVEEPKSRKTDFLKEVEIIKGIYNEIQISAGSEHKKV